MTDLSAKLRTLYEKCPTLQVERFLTDEEYARLAELIVVCPVTPVGVAWIRMKELTETDHGGT
jgi:hypothetical protein